MSPLTVVSLARHTWKRQRINVWYFLAHFCCWLLAQQFLDTAGSERVNEKLTQRFLGCLARVPAERRRTERFPEKFWKRQCRLPSYKWCTNAALCSWMGCRGASLALLNDTFWNCKSTKYAKNNRKYSALRHSCKWLQKNVVRSFKVQYIEVVRVVYNLTYVHTYTYIHLQDT